MKRPITLYYAATILFVLLDFGLGINIRAAFLEPFPTARVAYYVFCYGCLALMLWRLAWALVGGIAYIGYMRGIQLLKAPKISKRSDDW